MEDTFQKQDSNRRGSWWLRVCSLALLVAGSSLACAVGEDGENAVYDSVEAVHQSLAGECTTTSQCRGIYGNAANDCANSRGGICLCNPAGVECFTMVDASGGASSGGAGDSGSGTGGGTSGSLGPSDSGNPAVYTGRTHWKRSTGVLTFLSNGTLPNGHDGWNVPAQVKKIVIAENTRVSGRFDVANTIEIVGENRTSSVLFGTSERGYNKAHDGCGECKSAVRGEGNITVTVRGFTSLNPYGFHFTGKRGAKFVVDRMRALDDRGGHGNNSDGISAADGTIVKNSYFESGDDIIKVYADIEVIDTEIKMVTNTVPIQFGWGNYGSGARGVFRNLKITGTSGRHADNNALISGRTGTYNKSILIDGLDYRNPHGSMMVFRESRGNADIEIKNAFIEIEEFRGPDWSMNVDPKVCGVVYNDGQNAPNRFDCRN